MKKVFILFLVLAGCGASDEVKRDRFYIQGNDALQNRGYDEAIKYYDKAIAIDDSFARAYNNRGVAKIEDGKPYEAIQDYNQAIQIDSSYHEAIFNRAYAYEQVGKIDNALADIDRVKEAYPDSAYVYFYEGLLKTHQKEYQQGVDAFQKALQLDPDNMETRVNLATLYYFMNETDTARQILSRVLEEDPDEANALNTLSQIYLDQQDYQNAMITINQALEIVPAEPYFLNNRGRIYLEMDSLELALKDINRSILRDPNNAWAYRNKGLYHLEQGNFEEAIRLFQTALGKSDLLEEIYTPLGRAYQQNDNLSAACEAWEQGIANQEASSVQYHQTFCK